MLLVVSGCGGGGSSGGSTAQPFKILYSFGNSSTDAMGPDGGLFQDNDGNVYGTTSGGGIGGRIDPKGGYDGNGTVYKISPTGEETVLYLFGGRPADGVRPEVLIQGRDGNFYGTTASGGANTSGTVFKLTPEGVETILYSFGGVRAPDGGIPAGGVVQGSDGNLYVTGQYGVTATGSLGDGVIFKLTPEGVLTVLHTFTGGYGDGDGIEPFGGLLQGSDGNIYGVTVYGGSADDGTVFKVTPGGLRRSFIPSPGRTVRGPPAG